MFEINPKPTNATLDRLFHKGTGVASLILSFAVYIVMETQVYRALDKVLSSTTITTKILLIFFS